MKIRPHHLLCTQAYEGNGYNKEFIDNMDKNIKILRECKSYKVEIKSALDNLCIGCPHNNKDVCSTQEKVMNMDKKVLEYFDIKEGIYEYKMLIDKIQRKINKDIFTDICSECEWYEYGICEKLILKNKK